MIRGGLSLVILSAALAAAQSNASAALAAKTGAPDPIAGSKMSSPNSAPIERTNTAATPAVATASGILALPKGSVSLFGGMIQSVDHVRDRLILQVFQGRRLPLLFDERTQVLRDGKSASLDDVQAGERAYVDSALDGADIFARTIRLESPTTTGLSSGQVVEYYAESEELVLRDSLTPKTVKMRLAPGVMIQRGAQVAKSSELAAGTVVSLTFAPSSKEPLVSQITILASPGESYTFSGQVVALDIARGLLVLEDITQHKSYDLYFDPAARQLAQPLKLGVSVTAKTQFDGRQYRVSEVRLNSVSTR